MIAIEEYVTTSYEPECEFVDGELVERNCGDLDHSRFMAALIGHLAARARRLGVHVLPILRIRVSATRIRVADLCVISRNEPIEQIPSKPPLVCIEILSPEDRWTPFEAYIQDFLAMGVPHVWVFDPQTREVFDCAKSSRRVVTEDTLEAPPVSIHLSELFADLD